MQFLRDPADWSDSWQPAMQSPINSRRSTMIRGDPSYIPLSTSTKVSSRHWKSLWSTSLPTFLPQALVSEEAGGICSGQNLTLTWRHVSKLLNNFFKKSTTLSPSRCLRHIQPSWSWPLFWRHFQHGAVFCHSKALTTARPISLKALTSSSSSPLLAPRPEDFNSEPETLTTDHPWSPPKIMQFHPPPHS